jgi:hypothetical protein
MMENILKTGAYPGTVLPGDIPLSNPEIALDSHAIPGKDGKRCVEITPATPWRLGKPDIS